MSEHVPFKPSDLLERLVRHLNRYYVLTDGGDEYLYAAEITHDAQDNWSVSAMVTVTAPNGAKHRLRVDVHDVADV